MLFIEAIERVDELRRLPALLCEPPTRNVVVGWKTPVLPRLELGEFGYEGLLSANTVLRAALHGMQRSSPSLQ